MESYVALLNLIFNLVLIGALSVALVTVSICVIATKQETN